MVYFDTFLVLFVNDEVRKNSSVCYLPGLVHKRHTVPTAVSEKPTQKIAQGKPAMRSLPYFPFTPVFEVLGTAGQVALRILSE